MSDSPRLIDCLAVPFRLNTPRQHFITKSWVRLLYLFFIFSSVLSLSHVWLCDPMDCSTPGFPVHHQLPEFTQTHAHWVSDAIQPSHPLSSFSSHLQAFPASGSFPKSWLRWPKYWSFTLSISPSSKYCKYSGLISFRIDCFHLLAVQGTLKSLLQHHSSKASILESSASLWSNSHIHNYYRENHSFD